MCTGSRPSTSSTRTSRICRASAPRVCSSSNTVGSVRTGIPRARHSRTIRARVEPGAEGIAMITSSGSASSRMRGRSPSVLPRTRSPSMRRRALARVVVEEADRREPELAVAHDLARDQPPALAGAGDQHRALALAPRRGTPPAAGARRGCARARARRRGTPARAARTARSRRWAGPPRPPSRWPGVPPRRRSGAPGAGPRSATTVSSTISDHRPHDRLVVALAGVAPAALVDAREHEHRQAAQQHPPDRVGRAGRA